MPPGAVLHRLARRICSERAARLVVEPAIADLQHELSGQASGRIPRAGAAFGAYLAVGSVLVRCAISEPLLSPEERAARRRGLLAGLAGLCGATLWLLTLQPGERLFATGAAFALDGVIQALALGTPIGLTLGLAVGLPARASFRDPSGRAAVATALLGSMAVLVLLTWVRPLASDVQDTFLRSPSEALWRVHSQPAISAATLVLVGLLLVYGRGSSLMRSAIVLASVIAYWLLLVSGEQLALATGYAMAGAWLPNVTLASLAVVAARRR